MDELENLQELELRRDPMEGLFSSAAISQLPPLSPLLTDANVLGSLPDSLHVQPQLLSASYRQIL